MGLSTFSGEFIGLSLRQLEAKKIKVVNGKVHVVDFDLGNGFEVTYVFSITKEKKFFLQRANPYPMIHGKFANEKEIILFIKNDISAFRNAIKSSNFRPFVQVVRDTWSLMEEVENLFITRNVDPEDLREIQTSIDALRARVSSISNSSEKISFSLTEDDESEV